jgi:hypothetical protein
MASYQQQMVKFHQQVRATSEVWLAKTKKRIEIYKADLKKQGLDDNDKDFLKVSISLLEDEVKTYKELIAQTHRKK